MAITLWKLSAANSKTAQHNPFSVRHIPGTCMLNVCRTPLVSSPLFEFRFFWLSARKPFETPCNIKLFSFNVLSIAGTQRKLSHRNWCWGASAKLPLARSQHPHHKEAQPKQLFQFVERTQHRSSNKGSCERRACTMSVVFNETPDDSL